MSYAVLKMVHISSVIVSYLLFFLRGIWMIRDATYLRQRWVKIVPHMVDTVLLASAVALAIVVQQNPVSDAWLTAKVAGLLLYIGLGMVALRFGKTRNTKIGAWIIAQCVFLYIVLVALTKQPLLNLL